MKTGLILAGALAAVACSNSEAGLAKDRAADSRGVATSTGGSARPDEVGPAGSNAPGMAGQTKDADNTGINERDRRGTTLPLDQGSSAAETDITASIRREIMADEQLSFTGKNVKVITVGTKVTLRGPVKSDQARSAIAGLASRTAGVSEVDNQLEVKN